MSKSAYVNRKCDRCGSESGPIDAAHPGVFDSWGELNYTEINGTKSSNGPHSRNFSDVCPKCLQALHEWWANGKPISS